MGLKARAIMQPQVTSVSEDTPLVDVHRLFVEEAIHGAPVIRDDGVLVGVITSADLLRAILEEHESGGTGVQYLREFLEFSAPDWVERTGDFQDRLSELRVSDYMTESPATVSTDASIAEVARAMRSHQIHRVLVVEDSALVGIITTFDMVGLLEKDGIV